MDERLRRALRYAEPEDLLEALKDKGYIEVPGKIVINPAGETNVYDAWQGRCMWQTRTALVSPWLPGHCGKKDCKCHLAVNAVSWRRNSHKFSKKDNLEYARAQYKELLKRA